MNKLTFNEDGLEYTKLLLETDSGIQLDIGIEVLQKLFEIEELMIKHDLEPTVATLDKDEAVGDWMVCEFLLDFVYSFETTEG